MSVRSCPPITRKWKEVSTHINAAFNAFDKGVGENIVSIGSSLKGVSDSMTAAGRGLTNLSIAPAKRHVTIR
jgi:hypothetical protein